MLFASGSEALISQVIDRLKGIYPELPLVVVSEFPRTDCEWIPYHIKRSRHENLELCRARLADREVRIGAVILEPNTPYWRLRLIGFRMAPLRFMAFNEHGEHWMLHPRSALTIARHLTWRTGNFFRSQGRPGGFIYTWIWRFGHPSAMRRPLYYRTALLAGWIASWIKRGSPVAPDPVLATGLPDGISVVIPSRNGKDLLERVLPGVIAQNPSEIIVVDNGSDDDTGEFLAGEYPQVIVETTAQPLGFAPAVNRGIARARFSRVCLLNNDMVVEPGFFAALMAAFDAVPDLFCATAQIFFPQGKRREETGKAVMPLHRDRQAFPVRCDEPVDGENHTYVLYGSGGCSLYDTARLRALGGVAEVFAPAYCEDLDLGFRGWRLGWPTVFVAAARVLHHHRATTSRYYSEAELSRVLERNYAGFLTRSVTNRHLYRQLWMENTVRLNLIATVSDPAYVETLKDASKAPAWIVEQPRAAMPEPDILAIGSGAVAVFPGKPASGKPRVLIASPYLPYPLSHGGAVRMFNLMRGGAPGFDQVLICFVDELQTVAPELLTLCVEVICVQRYGTHAHPSTDRPDVVEEFDSPAFHAALKQTVRKWRPRIAQLEFTQMAQYAGDCAGAKTILVEHDITLDLYSQLLAQKEDWEMRRQYERWVGFEKQAWDRVDRIVTMSGKDCGAVGRPSAVCLPNGVDIQRFQPSAREPERRRLLFIGSFAHLPNVMAIEFFLREAWPILEPLGTKLHIIAGSRHGYFLERYQERVQLNLDRPGIEVEDFVSDVRPAYERATIVIAPLLASAGTNIKIMEAMAMGKAIVSTPGGVNGLDLENGRDVLVLDSGQQMAYAIAGLFENPEIRRALERQARATAVARYNWETIAAEQERLYRSLL